MSVGSNFCHGSVLAQTSDKLYCTVKEKLLQGQPSQKISELNKLWQKVLYSTDGIMANCCSEALLKLVKDGILKTNDALDTVVNLAASSKSVKWIVHIAFKLLMMPYQNMTKLSATRDQFICESSYKLHTHTHPFIFILNSCPQSWTFIIMELQELVLQSSAFENSVRKSDILAVFKPFFLFILLNPSVEVSSVLRKSLLMKTLMQDFQVSDTCHKSKVSREKHPTMIEFVIDVLFHIKLNEYHLSLHSQLFDSVSSSAYFCKNVQFVTNITFSILVSSYNLIQNPVSSSLARVLHGLLKIIPNLEQVCVLAFGLSNLICRASPETLRYLLHCVVDTLKFSNWFCYPKALRLACCYSMKAAILQLLLHKKFLGFCDLSSLIHNSLNEIERNCSNFSDENQKSLHKVPPVVIFHDSWLSDITFALGGIMFYHEKSVVNLESLLLLKSSENVALNLALFINGLFISDAVTNELSINAFQHCLNILGDIASCFSQLTLTILPSVLYCLKHVQDSAKQKRLILSLPDFAVDKTAMPLVLGTIQAMSQTTILYPLSINLMLELWKKQQRCFPYFQKMISQTMVLSPKVKIEVTTITVIAIREMCRVESQKNTSELLAMILMLLKKQLHSCHAAILLEGVYDLLDRGTVNIQSMWPEVKDLLLSYNSDTVLKSMLKILSLVPKFEVEHPSFTQFKSEILFWIWKHLENCSINVKSSALLCLAHFKTEDFHLMHLPTALQPQPPEEGPEEEFLLQPIPGNIFLQLANSVSAPAQVQYFCSSLLGQELENLPRDIKDRAFRAQKQSLRGNVFADFSDYILKLHDKNKQPNLKGQFATSVLMCYNPALEDSPKNLVFSGRSALQLLQVLLCEVTVDAKNWKGLLWIVQGWKHFMHLCLQIMVKGRTAELNMQLKQKDCDEEDVQHKLNTADLWCRDKITDLLKTSSKGSPTMQGNSLLALSGLLCALKVVAARTQEAGDDADVESSGYLSNSHWIGMATDTIITAADSKYRSKGRLFSWCQYKAVSRSGRLTTSKFGEVCALQSLKMLFPVLMSRDIDRVLIVLTMLVNRVGGLTQKEGQHESETPMIALHLNLTLGSVTADLLQGKVHETSNQFLRQMIQTSVGTLSENASNSLTSKSDEASEDEYSSDEDTDDMIGSLLGAGMLLPALFHSGSSALKEGGLKIFNQLVKLLDCLDDKSGGFLEAFYFAFILACIAGKMTKSIKDDVLTSLLTKLHDEYVKNKNIPTSVALSHLCYHLSADGEKQVVSVFCDLFEKFLKEASNDRLPTRQKLASINGLVALSGSEALFSGNVSEYTQDYEINLRKVVKLLKQFIQHGKDAGVTGNAILLLGRLYLSLHTSNVRQSSSTPSSYSYLPNSSVLRPMHAALNNLNSDDFNAVQSAKVILKSLAEAAVHYTKALPPVNWLSPFSKVMELKLTEDEQNSCLLLALSQISENETSVAFLDTCIEPSKFDSFYLESQCTLLKSLHLLIENLPSANVLSFLAAKQSSFFGQSSAKFCHSFLLGVLSTLRLTDLPQDVPKFLFSFMKKVIESYRFCLSNAALVADWKIIAETIIRDPEEKILSSVTVNEGVCVKILFIQCHFLSQGIKPIQWITDTLNICSLSSKEKIQIDSLWIVLQFLKNWLFSSSKNTAEILMWMQEMMIKLRKVSNCDQHAMYWLKVFSACVMSLANRLRFQSIRKGKLYS